MRGALVLSLVLVGGAAAGCGSNAAAPAGTPDGATTGDLTDISGWYQVTSYLAGPCGMTAASNLGPPYLWVERRVNTFVARACNGTMTTDCTGTLFYDFTQPIANGLQAEGGSAFFSAGCTLTWERAQATLSGSELHAKSLRYSTNRDIAEAACTVATASTLTEPCSYEIDLTATRL